MDSSLLHSNCGAYEILYWDAKSGKQLRSTRDSVESDALWNDWTCVLGFPVMGIWEKGGEGTDVNSVHRSSDGRLILPLLMIAARSSCSIIRASPRIRLLDPTRVTHRM